MDTMLLLISCVYKCEMSLSSFSMYILYVVFKSLEILRTSFVLIDIFRMKYEQDRLLKRINFLLTNFDGELKTLRHEKSQCEVTLKNADLRYFLIYK